MSSKTIQFLTPTNEIHKLIFAHSISIIDDILGIKIKTTNHKITNYCNKCTSLCSKEYIKDELNPLNLNEIFILHIKNNKQSLCIVYNNMLSRMDLKLDTLMIGDLIDFCTQRTSSSISDNIINKYQLLEVNDKKVYDYKKMHYFQLFNKLEDSDYWLPKEICFNIMLLVKQLLINSYFIS